PARHRRRLHRRGSSSPPCARASPRLGLMRRVAFLGEQLHSEALRHLARARFMLQPSRWKGLPISVTEAMHLEMLVIASNVPGTKEPIANRTGRLIASEDFEGYA